MDLITGFAKVCRDLAKALEDGMKVTAKVRWLLGPDKLEAPCWVHCTPLMGPGNVIRVWTAVLISAGKSNRRIAQHKVSPQHQDSNLAVVRYNKNALSSNSSLVASDNSSDTAQSLASNKVDREHARKTPKSHSMVRLPGGPSLDQRRSSLSSSHRSSVSDVKSQSTRKRERLNDAKPSLNTLVPLPSRNTTPIEAATVQKQPEIAGSHPGRRTYKSLSPYGVLFQN